MSDINRLHKTYTVREWLNFEYQCDIPWRHNLRRHVNLILDVCILMSLMRFFVSHKAHWREENATIYTKEGENIRQLSLNWTDAGLGVTSDRRLVTATSDQEIGLAGFFFNSCAQWRASIKPLVRVNGDRACTKSF